MYRLDSSCPEVDSSSLIVLVQEVRTQGGSSDTLLSSPCTRVSNHNHHTLVPLLALLSALDARFHVLLRITEMREVVIGVCHARDPRVG